MQVEDIKGVGPSLSEKLVRLGIKTVDDLVNYFPRDYRDESQLTKIGQAKLGHLTSKVRFSSIISRSSRKGMNLTEAIASDETGSVKVIWFKQPYRAAQISGGNEFYISGELSYKQGRVSVISPVVEPAEKDLLNTGRIIPIYRESKGITSRQLRKIIKPALSEFKICETLPEWLLKKYELISKVDAYSQIHFPDSLIMLKAARRRLGFEELLGLMTASALNKQNFELEKAPEIPFKLSLAKKFVASLPFKLTDAQRKVIWQMYQDMSRTVPSNRLIEGDVGAGKTVVAAMAALMALEHGYQVAFMAPTELLARQHANNLQKLMESVGKGDSVSLLVGSLKKDAKLRAQQNLEQGKIGLVIGTHALIQDNIKIPKLGLVIVDEQHRFGVQQRKKLESKSEHMPHSFYLTATPIPRSLALTLYGEMDISVIDQKPEGRIAVETKITTASAMTEVIRKINSKLTKSEQVFVVCPNISKKYDIGDFNAAENVYKYLTTHIKLAKVGLLHGKMKSENKEEVMTEVVEGKIGVLVATTVIEVGVDVPNASLMVVMGAEKFGLAQLHQLRGRVGRSGNKADCLLVTSDDTKSSKRLQAMTSTNDGFKLAEYDLGLRGPGAIYGSLQHGALDFKIAKLTDTMLISEARQAAKLFLKKENPADWPDLLKRTDLIRSVTYLN
ncbi:MAG: ATP-dependent DNA helicase RecG [bacterium]|nr:ATP-dependent DNA helicase RecG [bacterium]